MRLIDIDALPDDCWWCGDEIIEAINNAPTVEPNKTGHWESCGNHHLCSECDEWAFAKWDEDECDEVDVLTDFCPHCGARMVVIK